MKDSLQAELVSKLKAITVEYPESFPVTGSERILFDYQLKRMLREGHVCPITMSNLYGRLGSTPNAQERKNREYLEAFQWDHFEKMPSEILQLLPDVIRASLGLALPFPVPVETAKIAPSELALSAEKTAKLLSKEPAAKTTDLPVHTAPFQQVKQRRGDFGAAAGGMLFVLAVVGVGLTYLPARFDLGRALSLSGSGRSWGQVGTANQTKDILNATLSTSAVRSSLNKLASGIKNDGTVYRVRLTITRD